MIQTFLVACLLCLDASTPDKSPQPVYEEGPIGSYSVYNLQLFEALTDGKQHVDLNLLITTIDGEVIQIACATGGRASPHQFLDNTLKVAAESVSGSFTLRHYTQGSSGPPRPISIRLQAIVQRNRVEGTYTSESASESASESGASTAAKGKVAGRLWSEMALATRAAVPRGIDWPCWMGPHQSFAAASTGSLLIEDLRQARLLWRSPYFGPVELHRTGLSPNRNPPAGGNSPIVYQGKLYQTFFVPSGNQAFDRYRDLAATPAGRLEIEKQARDHSKSVARLRENWLIDADDVIACTDAATGKQLWVTRYEGTGISWPNHKSNLNNWTPCAFDGRIYALGSAGLLVCLDAESGKELWLRDVPGLREEMLERRRLAHDKGGLAFNRSAATALNHAGGVLLVPTSVKGGLAGFDAKTGELLWADAAFANRRKTPLRWSHGGRDYILDLGRDEKAGVSYLRSLEPRTGRALWKTSWKSAAMRTADCQPGLRADYLVTQVLAKESEHEAWGISSPAVGQVGCFRLTLSGAERIWDLPVDYGYPGHKAIVIADGMVFLQCRTKDRGLTVVEVASGKVLFEDPAYKIDDEAHAFWVEGRYLAEPDSQHDKTDWVYYRARKGVVKRLLPNPRDGEVVPWHPPHAHTTSYHVPLSHAVVDGRVFVRGQDGVYCYDLRELPLGASKRQAIHFPAPRNREVGSGAFVPAAAATSGLPVAYKILSGPARFSNGRVVLTGEQGVVRIEASQSGDTTWCRAKNVSHAFAVGDAYPAKPTSLQARPGGARKISLTWKLGPDRQDSRRQGIKIERAEGRNGPWTHAATVGANATRWTDHDLERSTTRFYRVRAFNEVLNTPLSSVASAKTNGRDGRLYLEAEDGAPSPDVRKLSNEAGVSGGRFVEAAAFSPAGPSAVMPPLKLDFAVKLEGEYRICARTRGLSGAANSFWIRLDERDWQRWDVPTTGSEWGWGVGAVEWLDVGKHIISIGVREKGASLDRLYLTTGEETPE